MQTTCAEEKAGMSIKGFLSFARDNEVQALEQYTDLLTLLEEMDTAFLGFVGNHGGS